MSSDLMIDIETLGTSDDTIVLSVGVAMFNWERPDDPVKPVTEFGIDVKEQEKMGRTLSIDTLMWWMQQSDKARRIFDESQHRLSCMEAVVQIVNAVSLADGVWANGPDFDCRILGHLTKQILPQSKWPFWKNRCVRTMKGLYPEASSIKFVGTAHNALADAVHQAEQMRSVSRYLKGL